jgi:hypothetical protein
VVVTALESQHASKLIGRSFPPFLPLRLLTDEAFKDVLKKHDLNLGRDRK